jgi:hypothetical protein
MANVFSRRKFLQTGALALGTVAVSRFSGIGNAFAAKQEKSQVFFTNDINAAGLLKIYSKINQGITGKVGIKLHTGEQHGPNILPRDMVKALQRQIPYSILVETNTLYKGNRFTTADHRETIKINGWDFCTVDIMDEDGAVMIQLRLDDSADPFQRSRQWRLRRFNEEYRHWLCGWPYRQENDPRRP